MSAYSSAVLADSPFLYWRLGESAGTTAADASGNGRTGTYHATGVTYSVAGGIAGDADTAVTFDGSAGEVHSTAAVVLAAFTVCTIEFWFKWAAAGAFACESSADASVNTGAFWSILQGGTSPWQLLMTGGGNQRTGTFPQPSGGVWHHMVNVFNLGGDTLKAYVDGVAQTVTPAGTATSGNLGNFTLNVGSRNQGASLRWNGQMDEFALYSSELSAARVTAHYRAGKLIEGARLGRDRFRGKTRLLPA
jgi:hypothetical protein